MDLVEIKDNVVARFELPGMDQRDVNVEVRNDRLTISGEKKIQTDEGGRFVVRERSFGRFARNLQLPEGTEVRSHAMTNELVADVVCLSNPSLKVFRRIWRRVSWRSASRKRLRSRRPKPFLLKVRSPLSRPLLLNIARNKSSLEQSSLEIQSCTFSFLYINICIYQ